MKTVAYIGIKGLPSQAGADRVVEAIVTRLHNTEYQPVVYCSNQVVPADTQLPGIKLLRMPVLPGKYLHATSLFFFSAIHALLFGRYDFIHLHNVEASFVLPILRLRYKAISTSHGAAQTREKWGMLAKTLIRLTEYPFIHLSDHVTSMSKPLAEFYEREYKKPVRYIVNGVNEENEFNLEGAQAVLQEHGIEAGNFLMFSAGRIIPTKGCHLVLEAFRRIDGDINLIVVGDATHMPEYEKELHSMADDRVHFIDFVADKAVLFGLIKLSRMFIFPSLYEAMSMMLLEVASLCVPVLCSDIPENVSVLPEHARFFKSNNADDLYVQLEKALVEPDEMKVLAKKANQWVNEKHQWSNIIMEYIDIYDTM